MLHSLKKFVPKPVVGMYHRALSWFAATWYGHPSEKLIVIGVTGTNGKTTTSYITAKALEAVGDQTGCTTTALFKVGTKEWLNDKKMTMLGRFQLQKLLRDMVRAKCRYVVIETSSQGIFQHRHRQINYDVCVFTNLTPEHVEAHGSFENYKQAKLELFQHLGRSRRKKINGKTIQKVAILNRASEYSKEFVVPGLDKVVWFGIGRDPEGVSAIDLEDQGWATAFSVGGTRMTIHMPGEVNVENALAAVAVATTLGLPLEDVAKKIDAVSGVPGRFERIDAGQPYMVIVDYAVEPVAMAKLYDAVEHLPHNKIIHVLGSCGGGRDVARRPVLGRLAAERVNEVIMTNEDPYDDDPQMIVDQIAEGARSAGRTDVLLHSVLDRREAIFQAMRDAKPGDLVLLTGKGCEQAIVGRGGVMAPWDEREVARAAIQAAKS